jgi:hypothetical protein
VKRFSLLFWMHFFILGTDERERAKKMQCKELPGRHARCDACNRRPIQSELADCMERLSTERKKVGLSMSRGLLFYRAESGFGSQ